MVSLCAGDVAAIPLACEAEVVERLASNMKIAEMSVEIVTLCKSLGAASPLTFKTLVFA